MFVIVGYLDDGRICERFVYLCCGRDGEGLVRSFSVE